MSLKLAISKKSKHNPPMMSNDIRKWTNGGNRNGKSNEKRMEAFVVERKRDIDTGLTM